MFILLNLCKNVYIHCYKPVEINNDIKQYIQGPQWTCFKGSGANDFRLKILLNIFEMVIFR